MKEKKKTHPVHYTVYHPNILMGANTEFKLAEIRLYTEVLNFNHQGEPERLNYKIPYSLITHMSDRLAVSRNSYGKCHQIIDVLQTRVFKLDKEFMGEHLGVTKKTSFNPFPTIYYDEDEGGFEMVLHPYFKKILLKLELGFTKGDIDFLRSLRHEYSHRFYWLIRLEQWKNKNKMNIELNELKAHLGCANEYVNKFGNFKSRVLDPIKKEFKGTWVEFDYNPIRGGRGGKIVISVEFIFKNDLEQEKKLQLKLKYDWEDRLLRSGINEITKTRIRFMVTNEEDILDKEGTPTGFKWDSFYVETCIDIANEEFVKRKKTPEPIKHKGNYLFNALITGLWIDEVKRRRAIFNSKHQLDIFSADTSSVNNEQVSPLPSITQPEKEGFWLPYSQFVEIYEVIKSQGKKMSEEEFAKSQGYVIKGDRVVKIEDKL